MSVRYDQSRDIGYIGHTKYKMKTSTQNASQNRENLNDESRNPRKTKTGIMNKCNYISLHRVSCNPQDSQTNTVEANVSRIFITNVQYSLAST